VPGSAAAAARRAARRAFATACDLLDQVSCDDNLCRNPLRLMLVPQAPGDEGEWTMRRDEVESWL